MQTNRVLTDFQPRHADLFGRHTVTLGHRLHESPLFTDDALARLIENAPRSRYHVNTMDARTHDPRTRREGEIVDVSGHDVLQAVRQGRIWVHVQKLEQAGDEYAALLEDMFADLEANVPGLKTFRHQMNVLISSPAIQVYYHADAPGQMLWQVRGKKRVYLYPASEPFLPQQRLEKIVLGEAHEISLDYHSWYDEYAEIIDLEPGRVLHWSVNRPHRIVNHDCLNISVATEHFTHRLRSTYLVNYANGLLHGVAPAVSLSQSTDGPAAWAKMGLAGFVKVTGMKKVKKRALSIDFRVDPARTFGVRDIEPHPVWK
jgi:hypothetical protein